jgi:hypothetical protein
VSGSTSNRELLVSNSTNWSLNNLHMAFITFHSIISLVLLGLFLALLLLLFVGYLRVRASEQA